MKNERMKIRKLRHHDFILLTQLKVIYFSTYGPEQMRKAKIYIRGIRSAGILFMDKRPYTQLKLRFSIIIRMVYNYKPYTDAEIYLG